MPEERKPPLFVFAIDAGDPSLIRDWVEAGALPNVQSLMETGFWATTGGPDLVNEHGAFVSLFSGISCARHGYFYSRQLRPGTYDLFTTTSADADADPFWSRLTGGERVCVIDPPDVRPVPGLRGKQLCDWATHNPRLAPAAEPPRLLDEAREVFGPPMRIVEKPGATEAEDRAILAALLERIERKGALCRHILRQETFDVVVIGFSESHPAAHQFWPYLQQETGVRSPLEDAIRDVYAAIDRELGGLLALVPDGNAFVVSSVGIQEQYPIFHLMEDFCRKLRYQAAPPPGPASFSPLDILRRSVPESWRIAVSRNFSRDTRERLLADQFRSRTDWDRTRLFAIPSSFTGLLRVNLRGREPAGIVDPGDEYRMLLDEVADQLHRLVDPVTGEPAAQEVFITVDRFGVDPPVSLPDIFVVWRSARHFMERVVHPDVELCQQVPEFSRDTHHCQSGFVCGTGPDIDRRGDAGEISVLDLAPTFLSLVDGEVPASLAGAPLRGVGG